MDEMASVNKDLHRGHQKPKKEATHEDQAQFIRHKNHVDQTLDMIMRMEWSY